MSLKAVLAYHFGRRCRVAGIAAKKVHIAHGIRV